MTEFFGTRRGIIICKDNLALVFKYNITKEDTRIEEEESSPLQTSCFFLPEIPQFSNVCVDEWSGCVAPFNTLGYEMVVIGFVLMYANMSRLI